MVDVLSLQIAQQAKVDSSPLHLTLDLNLPLLGPPMTFHTFLDITPTLPPAIIQQIDPFLLRLGI